MPSTTTSPKTLPYFPLESLSFERKTTFFPKLIASSKNLAANLPLIFSSLSLVRDSGVSIAKSLTRHLY